MMHDGQLTNGTGSAWVIHSKRWIGAIASGGDGVCGVRAPIALQGLALAFQLARGPFLLRITRSGTPPHPSEVIVHTHRVG